MKRPLIIINNHTNIEDVYAKSEEYLNAHSHIQEEISTYLWAYSQAQSLVPITTENFRSGHNFPFSESYSELEISFHLCQQGFYRHSLFALRCALELAVIGLCFDKNDQAHIDIQKWIRSEEPTPWFQRSLNCIFKLDNFSQFNNEIPLKDEIKDIYSSLSDYVHSRGYRYSNRGQSNSNINQFNELSLRQYVDFMKKVISGSVTMMLLKYPIGMANLPLREKFGLDAPMVGFLEDFRKEDVLSVVNEKGRKILQRISDNDPDVEEIVKQVLAIPDMNKEQLNAQRAEWDAEWGAELDKWIK